MILAGDIGGTKAQLALFESGAGPRTPVREERLPTRGSPSLEAILREFLGRADVRPRRVVLGIAGPVQQNRCTTTNLPWTVDGEVLTASLGAPVALLNDLEATAWGLQTLAPAELRTLHAGESGPGSRALIAPGTGLGEAILARDGATWRPLPSEGGHVDFGPRDALEDELLVWLRGKYGRVSYERILSGPGLADLYRFFREIRRGEEPAEIAARFDAAADPAAFVGETGQDGSNERARLALERFAAILGAEAGNLALKSIALGGVYVGGGIPPRILGVLERGGFVRAFFEKGRLAPLMARIPVWVVLEPRTAVWGAAVRALADSTT